MSYCRKEGKDKIIFVTEEYLSTESKAVLLPDNPNEVDTSNAGAILPNGDINWDCPCLGNLPNGPCGQDFREAFSCWVENRDDEASFAEKCFKNFTKWEGCISEHRDIYRPTNDDDHGNSADTEPQSNTNQDSLEYKENVLENPVDAPDSNPNTVNTDSPRAIAAASTPKQ